MMQQIQYFKSAWGDIKNSPGWFGKLCLLALLNFIPIFGQIVTYGYMYGWAREIAWGAHEPMPSRIFANEDGKLYRRGWFVFVLTFVFMLVAGIVMGIGSGMQGAGMWGASSNAHGIGSSVLSGIGLLVYLVGLVGALLLSILAWIGSMRISIYDRLSAGFQIGKIWKMFRHDTGGIMRIFGMDLLVGFIIGFILSILYFIVFFLIIFAGVSGLMASGYNPAALQHMSEAQATAMTLQFIASAGVVGFLGILLLVFVTCVGALFVQLLVVRAMGYWTMRFDVPHWRGQDDAMPFEDEAQPVYPYSPTEAASMPATPYSEPAQQPDAQAWQQTQPVVQSVAPVPVPPAAPTEEPYFSGTPDFAAVASEADTAVPEPDPAVPDAAAPEPDPAVPDAAAPEPDPAVPDAAAPEPDPAVPAFEPEGFVPAEPEGAEPAAEEQVAENPAEVTAPAGFTYSGAAPEPAPTQSVTPSGADPSAETVPDILVVIPEELRKDDPSE